MLRDASTSRPCERRDPYSADSRFGTGAEAFFTSEARGDGSLRSRLCENARGPRMRRIVFSFAFFRHGLTVQLVSTSTKSRLRFYTQVSCRTFHTAWNAGTHSHELGAFPLHRSIGRQHLRQQIILELGAGELAYEMDRSVGHADRTHQSELGLHEQILQRVFGDGGQRAIHIQRAGAVAHGVKLEVAERDGFHFAVGRMVVDPVLVAAKT